MRSLNELFEYLEHSTDETLTKDFDELSYSLIRKHGKDNSDLHYKDKITKLNTLVDKLGYHFRSRFPKLVREDDVPPTDDEYLSVEQVSKILNTTKQTIYTMVKKGKIKTINFSSVDKPGVRGNIRIPKSEIKNIGK